MDRMERINELFTKHCSITMPAEQYLFIYKEMQRLENENAWYKSEYEKMKQTIRK